MADVTIASVRQQYPQYSDMTDEQLGQALHQKYYSDVPYEQFAAKIGLAAPAPPPAAAAAPMTVGHGLAGAAEIAGAGIANIPGAAINAVHDLYQRIAHGDSNAQPVVPSVHPGQAGHDLVQAVATSAPGQAVGDAVHSADTALGNFSPTLQDVVHQAGSVLGDVGAIAPVATPLVKGVGALRAAGAAETPGFGMGFRNGENAPIAKFVAGDSGQPTLKVNNQGAGNHVFLSEAGVAPGVKPDAEAFTKAREPANSVYNRAAASVPTGTLAPSAASGIQTAGRNGLRMSSGSPDAAAAIEKLQTQLLAPGKEWTGDQVVNEIRGLRQEGYARVASEDPDSAALGRAQLDMSHALEQHIVDTLPTNAPVSANQLAQARVALAKSHTVESAMAGDDVDLAKLGRVANKDRDLMTGPMREAVDFINNNQAVIGLPGKMYEKPGMGADLHKAGDKTILSPNAWATTLGNIFGARPLARHILTGGAREATPVTGLGGEFGELPMTHLTPPGGNVGTPHQPDLGALPQGLGSRGSLELQPSPGDLGMEQRPLGDFPQGPGARPQLGLELSPGSAYGAHQPDLGDLVQGPGSRGNLDLTPPPGFLEPHQRELLGEDLAPTPKKKPKGK